MDLINDWSQKKLAKVALQLQEITAANLPRKGEFPSLSNIDYYAGIEPFEGCVGGDYLNFINFQNYTTDDGTIQDLIVKARKEKRFEYAAKLEKNLDAMGIVIGDSAGHSIVDSIPLTYFHGAFQMAVDYEFLRHGEITADFFKRFNRKYHKWLEPNFIIDKPYMTMLYVEVHNNGLIKYVNAGHPHPIIFSNEYNKVVLLDSDFNKSSTPLGVLPNDFHPNTNGFGGVGVYPVNELALLGKGDILLLHTDGLAEQDFGEKNFCANRLEDVLRDVKNLPAKNIYQSIKKELLQYCPPHDDFTIVVIKKTA